MSQGIVLGLSVCVGVSTTTPEASYLIYISKVRHHRLIIGFVMYGLL